MKRIFGIVIICLITTLFYAPFAYAQVAEVPQTDRQGNFLTTELQGNRGTYQADYWLVIDPDQQGLNCRRYNGSLVARLPYGMVLKSNLMPAQESSAIKLIDGQTWLRTELNNDMGLIERIEPEPVCYVRANSKYIAPINPDSLFGQIEKDS